MHLTREGSAIMFIGLGYCRQTGYNPGLLAVFLLDVTSCEYIHTNRTEPRSFEVDLIAI
jgi:hypothetical protein